MLVGFGAYGLEPQNPPLNDAQELQRQALRDGISAIGPQMDALGLQYQQSVSPTGNAVYLLTTQNFYDKRKYMNLGIGAAVGAVVAGIATYLVVR